MKTLALSLLATFALWQTAGAAEWLTDLDKAKAKAKQENKLVLVEFTGSDWCPPCIKMKKEVFSTKEFETYAKDNLVLVELDFPRSKPQSDALKKANAALSKQFNVRGFPTVVVLDGNGKELSRSVGYGGGGADKLIGDLKKLKKS